MSKKSRKRNKKILGALAAGLGAMALMKRKKASVANTAAMEDANINTNAPILGTDHITKKAATAVVPDHRFNTRFSKPREELISKAHRSQALQAAAAKNKAMNYQRSQTFDAKAPIPHPYDRDYRNYENWRGKGGGIAKRGTGVALKSGGRVKSMGIAKRGGGAAKR